MFDEPSEDPERGAIKPEDRAKDKADEFRMHAELCAVFEGNRKYGAQITTGLDAEIARDIQRAIGKLDKSKVENTPLIPEESMPEAARVLGIPKEKSLSTNDYHIHRRPGETMIIRWLEGDQVETFYTRLQAHFDAALNGYRQEERQSQGWKQDPATTAYLDALDAITIKMPEKYAREVIKQHRVFILSTQSADEMDILHLCDFIMGIPAAEIVGKKSAPPEVDATESDRAWFFKLFALRGMSESVEKMCFFAYLQRVDSWEAE